MRRRPTNRQLILLLGVIVLVIALISQVGFLFRPMLAAGNAPIEVDIPSGTPLIAVAWQLKRQGLLKDPKYFIFLAQIRGHIGKMKAGEYLITPGKTSPIQFLNDIVAGRVILRQVTIIDGWTFAQVMQAINTNPYLVHTLNGLNDQAVMAKLGYAGISPEGRFYPDTYLFGKGTTDAAILKKAYKTMNKVITAEWNQRAPGLPYNNPSDALTAASLIERETALDSERPMIAGVIVRRLQKGMRLQIDPTVIYALGDAYQGKLTSADMMVNSPYNTYLHNGLPPSPIGIPRTSSIYAALHPAGGDALYYVSNRNGSHVFSATLKQHDAAIDKYLLSPRFCLAPLLFLNSLRSASLNYSPMKSI